MILYNHEYEDALICDAIHYKYTLFHHSIVKYYIVIQLSYSNIITKPNIAYWDCISARHLYIQSFDCLQ